MTVAAAISINVCVIGLLFAALTARLSYGPGWRELRPFAACAGLASLYSACNSVVTLPVGDDILTGAGRLGLFAAGLHGSAWFIYCAAQEQRALSRFDRVMVALGVIAGLLALVPRLAISDAMSSRVVPVLGWSYRDALPTQFGEVCYGFYSFGIVVLLVRYFHQWRAGRRYAAAHFFGLLALLAAGVNDSLTASRVYDAPYLLDFGFLAVVGFVGTALTTRFVASAHMLEDHAQRLSATQAELVKRERLAALGELSAVVAHEVRNPVAIMFNALSVLRRQRSEGTTRETETLLAIVEEEAHRLKRMVDDLLAFARPQALRIAPVTIGALITSAVDAVQRLHPSVRVAIDIGAQLPPIPCDEQLVREAVINLLVNAMQASRGEEPISVAVTFEVDDHVQIAVTDDGAGVPPELVPRLFTPFFTTRPTGTGLGLAVVRRIAEAHGGEAHLAPSTGSGATFVLRLPIEGARPHTVSRTIDASN